MQSGWRIGGAYARTAGYAAMAVLVIAAEQGSAPSQPFHSSTTKQPVHVELITEHASIQPDGQTKIGAHFEIEAGWHIYAKHPGDAGLPTTIQWTGPSWVSFSPLHWPPPEQFLDPGDIKTYGYSVTAVLYSTLKCRLGMIGGQYPVPLPIQADVKWLACKEVCIPGSATLDLTLPVRSEAPAFSARAEWFEQTHE